MGDQTDIPWTQRTYNAWEGCTKVGPGCDGCFAWARNARLFDEPNWGAGVPRRRMSEHTRNNPLRWEKEAIATGKPIMVFMSSLADVFDNEIDPQWRVEMWDIVRRTPHLRYQIVTKRVGNIAKMLPPGFPIGYEHCGFMITVVNQDEADRDIVKLCRLKIELGLTWIGLSVEPQLGDINLRYLRQGPATYGMKVNAEYFDCLHPHFIGKIDWVITGGESRQFLRKGVEPTTPRPYDITWTRRLLADCKATSTAILVKQLGALPVVRYSNEEYEPLMLIDRNAGADMSEWPEDLRVRQFPEALR